jgi:hypothetical protein
LVVLEEVIGAWDCVSDVRPEWVYRKVVVEIAIGGEVSTGVGDGEDSYRSGGVEIHVSSRLRDVGGC